MFKFFHCYIRQEVGLTVKVIAACRPITFDVQNVHSLMALSMTICSCL